MSLDYKLWFYKFINRLYKIYNKIISITNELNITTINLYSNDVIHNTLILMHDCRKTRTFNDSYVIIITILIICTYYNYNTITII